MKKMLMGIVLAMLFLGAFPIIAQAEEYDIKAADNYGGLKNDYFEKVIATSDGGYLAIGYTEGSSTMPYAETYKNWEERVDNHWHDGIAIKFNADGEVEWARSYDTDGDDYFYDVIEQANGNYLIVGMSMTNPKIILGAPSISTPTNRTGSGSFNDKDGLVVIINPNGDLVKSYVYGGDGNEKFLAVAALSGNESGYVVVGSSTAASAMYATNGVADWGHTAGADPLAMDGIVVKLDIHGDVIWTNNYGSIKDDEFRDVVVLPNNAGYLIVGYSAGTSDFPGTNNWGHYDNSNYDSPDAIALKMDTNGMVTWSAHYGSEEYDEFNSVILLSDGSFIAVGSSKAPSIMYGGDAIKDWDHYDFDDGIVVKISDTGEIVWANNYGGFGYDSFLDIIHHPNSEGYIIVGCSDEESTLYGSDAIRGWNNYYLGYYDGIVVRMNPDGTIKWSNNYGGEYAEYFTSSAVLSDGTIVAAGASFYYSTMPGWDPVTDWGYYDTYGTDAVIIRLNGVETPPVVTPTIKPTPSPQTSQNNSIDLWVVLCGISALGLYIVNKKRTYN